MSMAKQIYYHHFRKARVEKGLPVIVPRPPGMYANELLKKRSERYTVEIPRNTNTVIQKNNRTFSLSINKINATFCELMKANHYQSATFISSCDPYENALGDIPNTTRHQLLRDYLSTSGLVYFEALTDGVDQLGWYKGQRQCFVIFDIPKSFADKLADKFHQNTYARVPNPVGYLRLEIRQPIHAPYYSLIDIWLLAFKGETLRAAQNLAPNDMASIMSVPPAEQIHWLHPEKWDLNVPWPLSTPEGDFKSVGTEWDRLTRLHKAATKEMEHNDGAEITIMKI